MSDARILDRGYRAYTGPRLGVRGAVRSLIVHSIQRALGLKRPVWQKILPAIAIFIAYVPAIVFVGLSVLLPDTLLREASGVLPTYAQYYGFISAAIVVFTAFVAPELLCTDRRTGMLGLYLASPLTRDTYLAAKAVATVALLALVTLGPPLLMLLGLTIVGSGPDGPIALLGLLAKMVLGGLAVAVLPASLSLAVSSITSRRAAASAAIIMILLASRAVSEALGATASTPLYFGLDLLQLPIELVFRIYGEFSEIDGARTITTGTLVAAYLVWTFGFGLLTWLRYRRLTVTR